MQLSTEQLTFWQEHGYLILHDFASPQQLDALQERAESIVRDFDPSSVSVFSTRNQTEKTDKQFLDSASGVTCFFEEKAFNAQGHLVQSKEQSINKIGHAMHDVDPVFRPWSRSAAMAAIMRQLGQAQPTPVQSMYIFKQPRIGGEVVPHQDSSFLYTTPLSCIGIWLAIEDATRTNGCLWALPGSHKGALARRFVRAADGGVTFDKPAGDWPLDQGVALEVAAGTLVVLHGQLVHWSSENTSDASRHAYSMHIVDGATSYAGDNWLQRDVSMPFEPMAAAEAA